MLYSSIIVLFLSVFSLVKTRGIDDIENDMYLNEVQVDEDSVSASKGKIENLIEPLDPVDVKCLVSADKHCSEEMAHIKEILGKAVKEECGQCSLEERLQAGRVLASLMAHDPVAFKLLLTNHNALNKPWGRN